MINWSKVITSKPFIQALNEVAKIDTTTNYRPSTTDYLLRDKAWSMYEMSLLNNKTSTVSQLVEGICSIQNFYQKVLKNPLRLAWILHPKLENEVLNKVLKEKALDRAFEILDADFANIDGTLNIQLISKQVSLIESILNHNE